ncbi:MAG: glycoside hydrolase family 2 TIM barrel-domain containing protein [Cyclobacteriaceae bacterium]
MTRTFVFTLIILLSFSVDAFDRKAQNINANWQYLEKPYQSPNEAHKDNDWKEINLPHTWNSHDPVDMVPGYRRDASWYKRTIQIDQLTSDEVYILYFEGVNIVSDIYVNKVKVGAHVGGYVGFEVPITEALKKGENEIMVRVDNGYNPQVIPSQKSDFVIYGGITRDVWLQKLSRAYISDVKITPEISSQEYGDVKIALSVDGEIRSKDKLKIEVFSPQGEKVFGSVLESQPLVTAQFKIQNPELWDVSTPNLYSVRATVLDGKKELDVITDRYGYRWFEFKDHGPFYLNGKRLLIRGTHRHEEHAGMGAAMPNELHRKDLEMIKGMGANFVRLGHYPQDPEVYKACDELGLLVWDELPWCRGGVGDDVWKGNTKKLLSEMIDQNYNHPSVILWSLGNEIYWLPDFEGGDDTQAINAYLKELNDMAHQLDPTRKTAIRKYYEGADIVDVFSPSIWSGWYSGSYQNYEKAISKSLKKYPHFIHMEYGGSSTVGRHSEQPINGEGIVKTDDWEEAVNQVEVRNIAQEGDWSENYIVDLFDWHLRVSESHDKFVGNAQWAFKDFATPLRPENDIPYINQKGLTDREGNPKDAYYVFKSYWSDEPFIYIESHTWTERSGPEGKLRNLSVFSNLEEVELFHNELSLGKRERNVEEFPACGLNWDIDFKEGPNQLKAIGYDKQGYKVEDTLIVNYHYQPALAPDRLQLSYDLLESGDYLLTATAVDINGRRCLDYEHRVYFQCLSGGRLNKDLGTPTGSEATRMANGVASIVLIADEGAETIKAAVLNQDFKGEYLTIQNTKITQPKTTP